MFAADIDAVIARSAQTLAAALELTPLAVPSELARLEGSFRGAPAVLEARAYRGSRTAYARFVRVRGEELEIGNVLCLSAAAYPLPILGVDLVAVARDTLVAVADLSPVHPDPVARKQQVAELARRRAQRPCALPRGEIPAWCASHFSSEALVTRVALPAAPLVGEAIATYVAVYDELAQGTPAQPAVAAEVSAAQRSYSLVHVEQDRGLGLLRKLFEPKLAERFLREVLFPERLPSWR